MRRPGRIPGFLMLLAVLSGGPEATAAGPVPARHPGQWSMFMNGPAHRGRSPYQGPQRNHLVWSIPTQTGYGGPVIASDGTIYQGTDFDQLLAINPDGTTKWGILTSRSLESTPAILPDGRI